MTYNSFCSLESKQFIPTHYIAYDSLNVHLQQFKALLGLTQQLKETFDSK